MVRVTCCANAAFFSAASVLAMNGTETGPVPIARIVIEIGDCSRYSHETPESPAGLLVLGREIGAAYVWPNAVPTALALGHVRLVPVEDVGAAVGAVVGAVVDDPAVGVVVPEPPQATMIRAAATPKSATGVVRALSTPGSVTAATL